MSHDVAGRKRSRYPAKMGFTNCVMAALLKNFKILNI